MSYSEAKTLMRSVPDETVEIICRRVAEHLHLCRRRRDLVQPGPSAPWAKMPGK
jgi:hypothetical protein